jgi:hypothetical protein
VSRDFNRDDAIKLSAVSECSPSTAAPIRGDFQGILGTAGARTTRSIRKMLRKGDLRPLNGTAELDAISASVFKEHDCGLASVFSIGEQDGDRPHGHEPSNESETERSVLGYWRRLVSGRPPRSTAILAADVLAHSS